MAENETIPLWTFDQFWDNYGKKVGKPNAIKQWKKLKKKDIKKVMTHVPEYVNAREKQYRKDPERYLKHKTFDDEIIIFTKDAHNAEGNTRSAAIIAPGKDYGRL